MIAFLVLLVAAESAFVEWGPVKGKNLPKFCDDIAVGVYAKELYVMHGKCQNRSNDSSTLVYNRRAMKLDLSSLGFDGTPRPLVLQKFWTQWQDFNYRPYAHPSLLNGEITFSGTTPSSIQVKHNGMDNVIYTALPTHSLLGDGKNAFNIILEFNMATKSYKNGATFNNKLPTGGTVAPENSCVMTFNENLYVTGGLGNDFTYIYDVSGGLWSQSMGAQLQETSHSGCAMNHDGTFGFSFGGYSGGFSGSSTSTVVDAIYEYDTSSQMWGTPTNVGFQQGAPEFVLSNGGRARSACFADNRQTLSEWKIYCIGGVRPCDPQSAPNPQTNPFPCDPKFGHVLSSVEVFDQETKRMTPQQSIKLSKPRFGFALASYQPVFSGPIHSNSNYNIQLIFLVGGMYHNATNNKVQRSNSIEYMAIGYNNEIILTPFTTPPTRFGQGVHTTMAKTNRPTASPYRLGSPSRAPVRTTRFPTYDPTRRVIFGRYPSMSPVSTKTICPVNQYICYYRGNLALRCEPCQQTSSPVCDSDNKQTACSRNDNKASHSFKLLNITIFIALNLLLVLF